MSDELFVGVDLGATKIAAGLVNQEGEILAHTRELTRVEEGLEAVIRRITACIQGLLAKAEKLSRPVAAVGICSPGPLDHESGVVLSPPNLTGWRDVPLKTIMEGKLSLPTFIEHDVKAAVLAEYHFGAGQGVDYLVYITVGTGIGAGILLNGELFRGCANIAGEVGHITIDVNGPPCSCGRRGCVEAFAAGPAIGRTARQAVEEGAETCLTNLIAGNLEKITAELVTQAAHEGDALARKVLQDAGYHLGIGLGNLANLMNPRRVVIGGGVSKAGEIFFEAVGEGVRRWSFPKAAEVLEIVPAALGDDVGILGAAITAWSNLG